MDMHRIAEIIKGSSPAGPASYLRVRQGEVVGVHPDGTIDVTIGGSTTVIENVACFGHVAAAVGAGIWLLTDGVDLIALGSIGVAAAPGGVGSISHDTLSGVSADDHHAEVHDHTQYAPLVARQSHIADASGGSTVDTEARAATNAILAALENYGLLATS